MIYFNLVLFDFGAIVIFIGQFYFILSPSSYLGY